MAKKFVYQGFRTALVDATGQPCEWRCYRKVGGRWQYVVCGECASLVVRLADLPGGPMDLPLCRLHLAALAADLIGYLALS